MNACRPEPQCRPTQLTKKKENSWWMLADQNHNVGQPNWQKKKENSWWMLADQNHKNSILLMLTLWDSIVWFWTIVTWVNWNLNFWWWWLPGTASPFFACVQLKDKRCCWPFEKDLRSVKLLSWKWTFSSTRTSCDLDDSVVWKSIFRREKSGLLGKLGSLSVTWRIEMQRKELHSADLLVCTHCSCSFLFETTFGKLFSVLSTFGFVFHDQLYNDL